MAFLPAILRNPSQRWKIYVLIGVILYFIAIRQVIHNIWPDHAFLALFIAALLLGKERTKRFLIDWSPFILFVIAYDMIRGVADTVRGTINVVAPYKTELILFGPFFGGKIPAFWFQGLQTAANDSLAINLVNLMCACFYAFGGVPPLLLGWILWHTVDDRKMFYRFIYTLTVLNIMTLITYMVYPAAPPWYVYKYGFDQPEMGSRFWGTCTGSLINVDRLFGVPFFGTLWATFNPNYFAAIPSLHGATPIVVSLFAYKKFKKHLILIPLSLYCLLTWFSTVYLNHHYIIDLIIGAAYVVIAYQVVERILMPKVFSRFLEK